VGDGAAVCVYVWGTAMLRVDSRGGCYAPGKLKEYWLNEQIVARLAEKEAADAFGKQPVRMTERSAAVVASLDHSSFCS